MDKTEVVRKRFDWLPAEMPGVFKLVQEKRAAFGNAHVNECWRRGAIEMEEGWFYAREGPLSIGRPWDDPALAAFAALQFSPTQSVLLMRDPGAARGAN